MITIRVQTHQGTKRLSVDPSQKVNSIRSSLSSEMNVEDQVMFVKNFGQPKVALVDTDVIGDCLRHGDMVVLEGNSDKMDMSPGEITVVSKPPEVVDVEDGIDQFLREQDGWVKREKTKYCQHNANASCNRCMSIAPWLIQNHDPWAEQGLKHIPFHAWIKQKIYESGSNTIPSLQEDTYRVENTGKLSTKDFLKSTATITRQVYRHVDHVLFEDKFIIDDFLQGWRATGEQRCGYLIGRYVPDKEIPLGIRAKVCGIYEAPQRYVNGRVTLMKDKNSDLVDQILSQFGLCRVGFIWTSINVENGEVISDREADNPLRGSEIIRMGHLQSRFPNPWNNSTTNQYGSKFVSVLCCGSFSDPGNVDLHAFQVSDQAAVLIKENILRPSSNPSALKVKKSDSEWIYPAVNYMDKNEYGTPMLKQADPYVPLSFFIIGVNHGFPLKMKPSFAAHEFPVDRYNTNADWNSFANCVRGKSGKSLMNALTDLNLVLFLGRELGPDAEILRMISDIFNKTSVSENSIKEMVSTLLQAHVTEQPQSTGPTSSTPVMANSDQIAQIMNMGFTIEQAQEALAVTGGNSVEQAINYLLQSSNW
eukprot:TRINITY_DN2772_c0_g1_i1.p1 TRINITY_DN2772_c0_g1~~TRINITY_DN2772_c0_g1_i1.p1  ORF type:complete len:591 (+),score=139.91 TRINITY_DN2772_c0_g1_i1:271-2043(+)